jgi:hypothetical protein
VRENGFINGAADIRCCSSLTVYHLSILVAWTMSMKGGAEQPEPEGAGKIETKTCHDVCSSRAKIRGESKKPEKKCTFHEPDHLF